jgi:hypothetical protein
MAEHYDSAFRELRDQIVDYSPKAARFLEFIHAEAGAQAGYYAAFVLICMHARQELSSYRMTGDLKLDEVQNFTFFEHNKDDQEALSLFSEMLNIYNSEQQAHSGV